MLMVLPDTCRWVSKRKREEGWLETVTKGGDVIYGI
jgi:hypothetical protein